MFVGIGCRTPGRQEITARARREEIRHAYLRTSHRRRGIGGRLLSDLRSKATRPLLVGTWAAAEWAIEFYRQHGFEMVPRDQVPLLLRRYWSIPERQIDTSVVLAEKAWLGRESKA